MSKVTIEDDALFFFDKRKQTFTGINAGDYIDKEDFEKFAASLTPSNEKYLKWVNCSERLPDVFFLKPVRFIDSHIPVHNMDKMLNSLKETELRFIEWLDESTPIPLTPCVELEKEVERLKGLVLRIYNHYYPENLEQFKEKYNL